MLSSKRWLSIWSPVRFKKLKEYSGFWLPLLEPNGTSKSSAFEVKAPAAAWLMREVARAGSRLLMVLANLSNRVLPIFFHWAMLLAVLPYTGSSVVPGFRVLGLSKSASPSFTRSIKLWMPSAELPL